MQAGHFEIYCATEWECLRYLYDRLIHLSSIRCFSDLVQKMQLSAMFLITLHRSATISERLFRIECALATDYCRTIPDHTDNHFKCLS